MLDRYLFRGKRIDNNEWVEGYYVYDNVKNKAFICATRLLYEWLPKVMRIEVDPNTICQFTGLCDKNGKKIWENDILMAHLDELYPEDMTYEAIQWGMAGWVTREAGSIDRQYLDKFDLEHYEVAGNTFDNPELLQEEHK